METPVILDVNPNGRALAREQDFLGKLGPKIENADGVIFQLDLDQPRHRRLLAKYVTYFDDQEVPIRVVVTPDQKVRWAKLLRLVEVWTPPVGVSKLDGFAAEVEYGWERVPKEGRRASGRR